MVQLVKAVNKIDSLDLALNWEIYECPECNGHGEIFDEYDGSTAFCENCDGTGELGLYENENGWDDPNNPSFDDLGMLKIE